MVPDLAQPTPEVALVVAVFATLIVCVMRCQPRGPGRSCQLSAVGPDSA
jgi:hypothetical protein